MIKIYLKSAEKCQHPREPLSGTPTAQIGGRKMIVQCVPYTARCSFDAHINDMGDNKRPFNPYVCIECEKVAMFG